eukprot:g1498.t1
MSSQNSNSSPTQDDPRVNESAAFNVRLARLIQQQELSFMMLARGTSPPSSEDSSLVSPEGYENSHRSLEEFAAFARVLRPMLGDRVSRALSEDYYSDDALDPDTMTYEELRNLSETIGYVNKGLSSSIINALPTRNYTKPKNSVYGDEQCTICCCEFEDKDEVKVLPCGHWFHPPCIDQWLGISKKCPICSVEVNVAQKD